MRTSHFVGVVALVSFGLLLPIASSALADTMQSNSAYPEVPAGNSPQPNGNGSNGNNGNDGNNGTPESNSAVPEVPAGSNPQPNGN